MSHVLTKPRRASVDAFLGAIENEQRQEDCRAIAALMQAVTHEKPVMWGPSIVGFGRYHHVYASGREGDWMLTGFSPRKRAITVYIVPGLAEHGDLLAKLGPHTHSVSCLYIKRLSDIHRPTLRKLVQRSVKRLKTIVADRTRTRAS